MKSDPGGAAQPPAARCPQLRAAAYVLGLEGVALVGIAGVLLILGSTGHPENRLGLLLQALLAAVAGLLLGLGAGPLLRRRAWVRSPLVVAQLLVLPVGVGLGQAQVWWVAGPVLALPLTVLALLATPSARAAFLGSAEPPGATPR